MDSRLRFTSLQEAQPDFSRLASPGSLRKVMMLDGAGIHRARLEAILARCGVACCWLRGLDEVDSKKPLTKVWLVALAEQPAPNAPLLGAIHTVKSAGGSVLVMADGVEKWPLRVRSSLLLAGAANVFDSAAADFESKVSEWLADLFRAEARQSEEERLIKETMAKAGIVGESPAMLSVIRDVLRISVLSDLPVLITGETGTGKELLAHAIHVLDPKRREAPFVAVNCGAISAGVAESELFGHRRGAFTGADRDRKGLVRSAQGGILFLDEIGELADALQTKLLRMLQERTVLGVGEDSETAVDVRIICATHRNLEQMVREKKFREDLFYRLNVLSLHSPPLRERAEDIAPLAAFFLQKHAALGPATAHSIQRDFLGALREVGLPGNVRQLENILRETLVRKTNRAPLMLADLPVEILRQLSKTQEPPPEEFPPGRIARHENTAAPQRDALSAVLKLLETNNWRLNRSLASCEKLLLEEALRKTQGNQSETARLLGITSRSVYNKVRKHRLDF